MKGRFIRLEWTKWLVGLLLLSLTTGAWGQMRVGAPVTQQPINPGASIEIQAGPYADSTYRGLLLPRLGLLNYASWSLAGKPTDGMMVFNTTTTGGNYAVSPGVYVWYNFQWNRLSTVATPAILTALDCAADLPASGAYLTGVPLTGANTKSVRITPGSAGTFTALANSADGYSFSASGTFTAAQVGIPQTVVLQGSGTPRSGGPTSFSLTVETLACSFTINAQTYVDCGGPLAGVYKVGQQLDASNTKQITITPRSAGEHFISIPVYTPDVMNYFVFTKRITFTAEQVGVPQTVVLEAAGTPRVAGTFNANVLVFVGQSSVVGCSISITIVL